MEVFLDDKLVDSGFLHSDTTLEEALLHVQSHLCEPGQLVVGLRCDGREIPANALAEALKKHVTAFARLEVSTGVRSELVAEAMTQASACLTQTEEACERIADLLTQGETGQAVESLGECLRVWQQIHEAVAKSIEMMQLDPEATQVNDDPLAVAIGAPKEVLLQIKEALQRQDYVLLADVLQYEFSEVINRWHDIVATIRREADSLHADRC